jgi:hypothetical protein
MVGSAPRKKVKHPLCGFAASPAALREENKKIAREDVKHSFGMQAFLW